MVRAAHGDVVMRFAVIVMLFAACDDVGRGFSPPAPGEGGLKPRPTFDIVIRGGEVLDGTGAPRKRADVGIRGDTIAVIGHLADAEAKSVPDAKGQIGAPGVSDLRGNSPAAVL